MGITLGSSIENLIGERWQTGRGSTLISLNPATGEEVIAGRLADEIQVDEAVGAARSVFPRWRRTSIAERVTCLEAFANILRCDRSSLAQLISSEVGKPLWESRTEVNSMIAKIPISIEAYRERCGEKRESSTAGTALTRFKPHGVAVVLGPFNFPGHIPNGHIVPALLAGNTVVFKPSEQSPGVGQWVAEAWCRAGLPPGVLNLVQGDGDTGKQLSTHPGVDAVLFTGGHRAGTAILRALAERPEVIVALEMGGNNPLVVWDPDDIGATAKMVVLSAFLTAGQRCTCARRLIVSSGSEGDAVLQAVAELAERITTGSCTDEPEPFMGPMISESAANAVLEAQRRLVDLGGRSIVECRLLRKKTGLLTPGLTDVSPIDNRPDEEIFGPLLQVVRVDCFEGALAEANATRFGLAAGLISQRRELYEEFYDTIRAGIVNWNQQLTGASSRAPFGGIGRSGNHRPSGYFAADYCSFAIGSIEQEIARLPGILPPGLEPR